MTKNKLGDLHNLLFAQMERLDNEDMSAEDFKKEMERSKAMSAVANQIIQNAKIVLDAQKFYDDRGDIEGQKPPMLEG